MKNMESYEYQEALLNYLEEKFKKFLELKEKYGLDDEFTDKKLDEVLYCKEMAETIINKPINIRLDNVITIGLDEDQITKEEYLKKLLDLCKFGEEARGYQLNTADSIPMMGETLEDFLDGAKFGEDGNIEVSIKRINEMLSECGFEKIDAKKIGNEWVIEPLPWFEEPLSEEMETIKKDNKNKQKEEER